MPHSLLSILHFPKGPCWPMKSAQAKRKRPVWSCRKSGQSTNAKFCSLPPSICVNSSFREQHVDLTDGQDFNRLKDRLQPLCQKTRRRQVTGCVRYTERHPILITFSPDEPEEKFYILVSEYLQRDHLQALPSGQRSLMTLELDAAHTLFSLSAKSAAPCSHAGPDPIRTCKALSNASKSTSAVANVRRFPMHRMKSTGGATNSLNKSSINCSNKHKATYYFSVAGI